MQTKSNEESLSTPTGLGAPSTESWLEKLRSHAQSKFEEMGYPTTKDESWKYTNLKAFQNEPAFKSNGTTVSSTEFVYPELSELIQKNPSVKIKYIQDAIREDDKSLRDYLNISFDQINSKAFFLENTARFTSGILIHVSEGASVELPLHLLYGLHPNSEPDMAYSPTIFIESHQTAEQNSNYIRNLIILEKGVYLKWIENFASSERNVYLNHTVNEVVLKPNSKLEHIKIQQEGNQAYHFALNHILQYRDSSYVSNVIMKGGRLARNEIHVKMLEEHCECRLNGIYQGSASQHLDHFVRVEHTQPNSSSSQLYRGTLNDSSTGVFLGSIRVAPGAQKTIADQSCKTILLSREAQMNAKPQLEILADDVKCSHGTTIGHIEEDALFYLNTRGVSKEEASLILQTAFLKEALESLDDGPTKEYVLNLLECGNSPVI